MEDVFLLLEIFCGGKGLVFFGAWIEIVESQVIPSDLSFFLSHD